MELRTPAIALLALTALIALPNAAAAGAIVVDYQITGGTALPNYFRGDITSGTVRVKFVNPSSGTPPISTTGHIMFYDFLTEYGSHVQQRFGPAVFSLGQAYRGAAKTLSAVRTRRFTFLGYPARSRFGLSANSAGTITRGFFTRVLTPEDTTGGWFNITGQEVAASTPEPRPFVLVSVAAGGLALLLLLRLRRRSPSARAST